MMFALVATATAAQHSTVPNNGYDQQSGLNNQCFWISVKQCLAQLGVADVSVGHLRELVRRHDGGEVNECNSLGKCDEYEPDPLTYEILQEEYGVRIKVLQAEAFTNPDVEQNPWEDYGILSPRVMDTDAPVCRIVHFPGHFELYANTSVTPPLRDEKWVNKISPPAQTPPSTPAAPRSIPRANVSPPNTDARELVKELELTSLRHRAGLETLPEEGLATMYEFTRGAGDELVGQLLLARKEVESLEAALRCVGRILSPVGA